jgi:carbonic anhydrase
MQPLPVFPDPTAPLPLRQVTSVQTRPTPTHALGELLAGNRRFVAGMPRYGQQGLAGGHGERQPAVLVVGCLDARVPVEAVFDQDFGAICVVRSGGHVLDRALFGSVEFAVHDLEVALVVVLGHERCAAVAAAVAAIRSGRRPSDERGYLVDQIAPAVVQAGADADGLRQTTRAHVRRCVSALLAKALMHEAVKAGRLDVVGAMYDLDTRRVDLV